ncbi:MAB_1171c family putative transporter [Streptomyces avermitilis]|uniref:MAB_1171c family putative transporter n=1 Tax=Streptomyces avermitilis TaxID=33903 RepID=UPI0033E13D46
MDGLFYYLTALILWTGLAIKVTSPQRHQYDPARRAMCAVVLLAGVSFALSAPPSVTVINRLTGIPNIAAPLVYASVTAFSAACLILIIYWRGGDPDHVRRVVLGWLIAYSAVVVMVWALFALGDAPVERRTDLDTYYATTPYIAEMITLYLVAHMVAACATTTLCWLWSRQVTGWTHTGLIVLVLGWLLNGAFGAVKLTAVVGRWTGHDWDTLSTDLAPGMAALAAALVTAGYILPLIGPRMESITLCIRLGPLYRLLINSADRRYWVPLSWRSIGDTDLRLTQRETGIRDGLKRLGPRLDDRAREQAYHRAISAGTSIHEAEAIATAAMIAVAAHATTPDPPVPDGHVPVVLEADLSDLVRVSQALRNLIVADAVRAERKAESQQT